MGVRKVQKDVQNIKFSWKVTKFAGKIGIDLMIIFCMNDFFCDIVSFWDMVDFVFFFLYNAFRA